MPFDTISIHTPDGTCPTAVFAPTEPTGSLPAAILYMDGFGMRPALHQMAARLADTGFLVLLPDLFYRLGAYESRDPAEVFSSGDVRGALAPLMASTNNQRAAEDTRFLLDYLDARSDVRADRIGVVGYCMGGGMALTTAATYPDRIAAAASFHGGGLATDAELSPHRLVSSIDARVYIGAADHDSSYPAAMAGQMVAALMEASVDHQHELYVGTSHGWTIPDLPVYAPDAADRHFSELVGLFLETLH